jgi:hypothetical protein
MNYSVVLHLPLLPPAFSIIPEKILCCMDLFVISFWPKEHLEANMLAG